MWTFEYDILMCCAFPSLLSLFNLFDMFFSLSQIPVYNWTVDRTVKWLEETVDLPMYAEKFQNNGIEGSALPRYEHSHCHSMGSFTHEENWLDCFNVWTAHCTSKMHLHVYRSRPIYTCFKTSQLRLWSFSESY